MDRVVRPPGAAELRLRRVPMLGRCRLRHFSSMMAQPVAGVETLPSLCPGTQTDVAQRLGPLHTVGRRWRLVAARDCLTDLLAVISVPWPFASDRAKSLVQ